MTFDQFLFILMNYKDKSKLYELPTKIELGRSEHEFYGRHCLFIVDILFDDNRNR